MAERDHAGRQPEKATEAAAARAAAAQPAALALQRAIGNRAMAQALQRMEVNDAIEPLEKSRAVGVLGAHEQVVSTLANFSMNNTDRDKVAIEYEKKTELPLQPAVDALGPKARATTPPGFFKGISGEKYPEPK